MEKPRNPVCFHIGKNDIAESEGNNKNEVTLLLSQQDIFCLFGFLFSFALFLMYWALERKRRLSKWKCFYVIIHTTLPNLKEQKTIHVPCLGIQQMDTNVSNSF